MKLYRCPHCGEKAFTSFEYNRKRLLSDNRTEFLEDHFNLLHCPKYNGAKFLIEDSDGIFVAKGKFEKTWFEEELTER